MSALDALAHHGIEGEAQLSGESDFDCAKRLLSQYGIDFTVRESSAVKYIIFSRLTLHAIAARITLEASLDALLMVQPFIEFMDDEIASY